MERKITIAQFISAIERLPSDEPIIDPRIWYTTQKEHWLGWLGDYQSPGAYGRIPDANRDAKFAYNHVVNYQMLLWLIEAGDTNQEKLLAAQHAYKEGTSMAGKSAIIRKHVPWEEVSAEIWGNDSDEMSTLFAIHQLK